MNIFLAMEMVYFKITHCIGSAFCRFHDMPGSPVTVDRHRFMTSRADTLLLLPDTVQLASAVRLAPHFPIPARLKVGVPLWIMRVGIGFDLYMPLNWRVRFVE